jgi:hypothetical protein
MADGYDVQAAVDRLAALLEQSVLVEDRDQRPVWWSTRGAVDATRRRTILDRRQSSRRERPPNDQYVPGCADRPGAIGVGGAAIASG